MKSMRGLLKTIVYFTLVSFRALLFLLPLLLILFLPLIPRLLLVVILHSDGAW